MRNQETVRLDGFFRPLFIFSLRNCRFKGDYPIRLRAFLRFTA